MFVSGRRLHASIGAGLQQGVYAGLQWQIPMTSNFRHRLIPEVTAGVRPGRWRFIGTAAIAWQYMKDKEGLGWECKAKLSFENWKMDAEEISQQKICVSPGIVAQLGSSLISVSVGPGIAFTTESREFNGKTFVTEQNQLVIDVAAGITF